MLVMVALAIMLVGCQSDDSRNEPSQGDQRDEVTENVAQVERAPLSGEITEIKKDTRPFAVMVNNDEKARPQSGLHKADIVYEILAEGDITRFLAIFHSELPDTVGPVRSARDYFVDLTKGYNALYVFHGWSPAAKEKIEAGEVDGINGLSYDGTLFNRASFRKAPHNSYITSENIEKGATMLNYSLEATVPPLLFLKEEETNDLNGTTTDYVKIEYSSRQTTHVEYKYNHTNDHYVRYSAGEKLTDLDTLEEISAANILIVETEHTVLDKQGRRFIDIESGGQAVLIQKGIRYDLEWKMAEGKILPFANGQQVPLAPGKTWIQVVPNLNIVSY
ncbi:Putative lipoprotein YerB [Sutcliffiella rhizosphaerae]|uniref:Lipoprotein YerB n=1 Tax=Sutcliffiella rhizosphaerae TaxID=2880967 RepID=A0ABN8A9F5_9BACI|nr:Putative lipoprotein YerB [Sutcliffiella rhizosphaerae]